MIAAPLQRIRQAVEHPAAPGLLEAYFDPGGVFAGRTFLDLEPGPADRVTSADLLATSLLDVSLPPPAVRRLLAGERQGDLSPFFQWLEGVPEGETLGLEDELRSRDDVLLPTIAAWHALQALPGVGPVIAGKLMARKRPQLIPIVDRVVIEIVAAEPGTYWEVFDDALRDPRVRAGLRETAGELSDVPALRLLDVLIWMLGSRSSNASAVREEAGLSADPWAPTGHAVGP